MEIRREKGEGWNEFSSAPLWTYLVIWAQILKLFKPQFLICDTKLKATTTGHSYIEDWLKNYMAMWALNYWRAKHRTLQPWKNFANGTQDPHQERGVFSQVPDLASIPTQIQKCLLSRGVLHPGLQPQLSRWLQKQRVLPLGYVSQKATDASPLLCSEMWHCWLSCSPSARRRHTSTSGRS